MKKLCLWFVISCLILLSMIFPLQTEAASSYERYYYGSNFYFNVYVPSSYQPNTEVPLIVMLHGCSQTASDFATGTKMNQLAEEKNFIVLYPEMNPFANSSRCWNWFYTYNQTRGSGEPAIIAGMTDWVKNNYSIQSDKVFVAGLSAGAYMSTIMGATYPDVYSGIGVSAGGMYKAATTSGGAINSMYYGSVYSPKTRGYNAFQQMGQNKKRMPVIVFHGSSDSVVHPVNASQVVEQWAETNDYVDDGSSNNSIDFQYDEKINGSENGKSYSKYTYFDQTGNHLIEYYYVSNLDHAWSGGDSSGSYTDPNGPDTSRLMYDFFISH